MKLLRSISALMGATALTLTVSSYGLANDVKHANVINTATPIKHLIVIYGENVSFDHYFGTYPNATNPPGEPPFHAKQNTPTNINTTPFTASTTGAVYMGTSQPVSRFPKGMPPRNAKL